MSGSRLGSGLRAGERGGCLAESMYSEAADSRKNLIVPLELQWPAFVCRFP